MGCVFGKSEEEKERRGRRQSEKRQKFKIERRVTEEVYEQIDITNDMMKKEREETKRSKK